MLTAFVVLAVFGGVLFCGVKISGLANTIKILERKQAKTESYITYLSEEVKKLIDKGSVNVSAATPTAVTAITPAPIEETPIIEEAPITEKAPIAEEAQITEETPTAEETPTPIIEETPDASKTFAATSFASEPLPRDLPAGAAPHLSAIPTPIDAPTPVPGRSYENFIGGRLFAVLAAVLIFIGMIFLAVTAFTRFGQAGKVVIMFSASAVVSIAGGILTYRAKNAFTTAVTGCGLGMLLISLMATYFYFGLLPPFALVLLLIVWGALVLYLSKKFDSFALTVFSHIGLTLCFCFTAFSEIGLRIESRWEFIAFECAASALMIIGGILMSRRVTLSGLIATGTMLFFTVISFNASSIDFNEYGELLIWTAHEISETVSLIIQMSLATAVGIIACLVLERNKEKVGTAALIQSLFGFVFAITYITVVGSISEYFRELSGAWYALGFTTAMVIFAAVMAVFPILRMKRRDDNGYYTAAAWFLLGTLFIGVEILSGSYPLSVPFEASLLLPLAFFMLFLYRKRAFAPLIIVSIASVGLDYIRMIASGFSDLSNVAKMSIPFTAGYGLLYLLYAFTLYKIFPKTKKEKSTLIPIRIISIILAEVCLLKILDLEIRYSYNIVAAVMFCIIGTIIWCIYANLKTRKAFETVILIVNEAVILIESFRVLLEEDVFISGLLILFFAAIFALFRVSLIFTKESRPAETIYSCVKCAALLLVAAAFLGAETQYIFSIILMLTGLIYIVGGFILGNNTLRGAGLAVSIIAVIKMTIVDVWETDNIVRVIALITGGVICFVISAIYNKTAKKLKEDINNEDFN
jgi:hypothetical protein